MDTDCQNNARNLRKSVDYAVWERCGKKPSGNTSSAVDWLKEKTRRCLNDLIADYIHHGADRVASSTHLSS